MNERYVIKINGKDYILFSGLLEEAHRKGLTSVNVQLVQIPNTENGMSAICKATIEGKNGEVFSDYGDANPKNVSSKLIPHIIRMASTRAQARCFRTYCNIGTCSFEEMNPDDDDFIPAEPITINQINLIKKLSDELDIKVEYGNLSKDAASNLIKELMWKKENNKINVTN